MIDHLKTAAVVPLWLACTSGAVLVAVPQLVAREALALGLSISADVLGWSLDRLADALEPPADLLAQAAEAARWTAKAARFAP